MEKNECMELSSYYDTREASLLVAVVEVVQFLLIRINRIVYLIALTHSSCLARLCVASSNSSLSRSAFSSASLFSLASSYRQQNRRQY